MRILDRFVAGTFLKLFFVSILATPPLFILGDLTEKIDDYLDQDLAMADIARGYLFNIPEYLHWSFPIAGLIAAVFTVHGMTTHREVVAAKAGGVSFHRLILPVLVMGAVLTGVALAATDLVPLSKRRAAAILEQRDLGRTWRSNFAYQTETGLFLSVQRLELDAPSMMGVAIHRTPHDDPEGTALFIDAERASWDSIGWTFHLGTLRRIGPDGSEVTMRYDQLRMAGIEELPEDLMEEPRDEEEMTYAELERQARIVERGGGNSARMRVKLEQKLAIPVATLVIILFGAPLATSAKRGGAAYGIGISLGSTILYLLLFKVAAGFGAAGALPPVWAAWAPNALFLAAGLFLMARVRT